MWNYILRRCLLMLPTLLGIITLNFIIIQAAPGGPVEQSLAKLQGIESSATSRVDGSSQGEVKVNLSNGTQSQYRGAQGIDPEYIKELERLYGFDKPLHERYWLLLKSYLKFDFGDSFFRDTNIYIYHSLSIQS